LQKLFKQDANHKTINTKHKTQNTKQIYYDLFFVFIRLTELTKIGKLFYCIQLLMCDPALIDHEIINTLG